MCEVEADANAKSSARGFGLILGDLEEFYVKTHGSRGERVRCPWNVVPTLANRFCAP